MKLDRKEVELAQAQFYRLGQDMLAELCKAWLALDAAPVVAVGRHQSGTNPATQRVDVERLSVSVERLPPIERDEQMQRDYIPIPGGWEVQTKGNGSTYRIARTDDDDGERWPVTDRYLQDALTNMAHAIRADYAALLLQLADYQMAASAEAQLADERGETINQLRAKLAERDAAYVRLYEMKNDYCDRFETAERAREGFREELATLQVIHNCLRRDHERSKARAEVARDAISLLRRLNDANYWNCGECLLEPEAREDIAALLAANGGSRED